MHYERLSQKPREFLAMTGYTLEEFHNLLPTFEEAFQEHTRRYTLEGFRRENRKFVSYKNSPLPTPADRLLFILSYLKQHPTQTYHALAFGLTQPKANQWLHLLHPVLNQALASLGELPARPAADVPPSDPQAEGAQGVYYWQDGTERPIPRPTAAQAQQLYYSGKKKRTPSRM